MDNREANNNPHPPACTCRDCVENRLKRQEKQTSFDPRFHSDSTVDKVFAPSHLKSFDPVTGNDWGERDQIDIHKQEPPLAPTLPPAKPTLPPYKFHPPIIQKPEPPSPPPPKFPWGWILLVVIIVIALIANERNQPKYNPDTPTATPTVIQPSPIPIPPTPTVAPIPTPKPYLEYTDPVNQFSLNYPIGWLVASATKNNTYTHLQFTGNVTNINTQMILDFYLNSDAKTIWQNLTNKSTGMLQSGGPIPVGSNLSCYELIEQTNTAFSRTLVTQLPDGVIAGTRAYPQYRLTPTDIDILDNYLTLTMSSFKWNKITPTPTPKPTTPIPTLATPVPPVAIPKPTFAPVPTTIVPPVAIPIPKPVQPSTPTLKDPTWNQLLSFLQADNTDALPYIYPTFVCANFASTLQNNAKKAGWRCAKVSLDMTGYTDPYHLGIGPNAGHACNAFQTTDRGLVYIDCTGPIMQYPHPPNNDTVVTVVVGQRYIPKFLFPNGGWSIPDNSGTVTGIDIKW